MALSVLVASILATHAVVDVHSSNPTPDLTRTEYEVEVGEQELNHYSIVNVRRHSDCRHHRSRGAVMLLSPFTLPAEFYEISESGRYVRSLAGRLARLNYDLWLVGERQTGLAPGDCESGVDCSAIGEWNTQAYVDDAVFALSLLRGGDEEIKPAIGGFSAGSNMAMAAVNQMPDEFAGLMMYEGTYYTEDPVQIAHNQGMCSAITGLLDAGQLYDPSIAILGQVLQAAQADPDGVFPVPGFPPGTTNTQAMLFIFGSPPPIGALSPTPDFIRNRVDFDSQTFLFTDPNRLMLVGPLFDNYASLSALKDLACGMAGQDTQYIEHLDQFAGDVMMFVGGTGFGPAMLDTASLFSAASSVSIESQPDFGEADFYFNDRWESVFLGPLRHWLAHTL